MIFRPRRSRLFSGFAVAGLVLAGGGTGVRSTGAYEFLIDLELESQIAGRHLVVSGREELPRWDPRYWGPGAPLYVVVRDDPRWLTMFPSMEAVREQVAVAVDEWSRVESADIRWSVREERDPWGRNIYVELSDHRGPYAERWASERGIIRCTVVNSVRENVSDAARFLRLFRGSMRHELGHCLGLWHSPYHSTAWELDRWLETPWGKRGVMAPVGLADDWAPSLDDRVGASLLRPAPLWLESVGSIYGTVLGEGFPVGRHVIVLATRLHPDGAVRDGGVTRITGQHGDYWIGGLSPGKWLLMVRPLASGNWNPATFVSKGYGLRQPTLGIATMVHLTPIEVRAGEATGPVVLRVRGSDYARYPP